MAAKSIWDSIERGSKVLNAFSTLITIVETGLRVERAWRDRRKPLDKEKGDKDESST